MKVLAFRDFDQYMEDDVVVKIRSKRTKVVERVDRKAGALIRIQLPDGVSEQMKEAQRAKQM